MNPQIQQKLTRKLAGFLTPRRLRKLKEVLSYRTRYLSVVLEDIYQSQNASAVLRSCECYGIQDVHIIENQNAFELNPEVVMGASKWLSLHRYNKRRHNTRSCLEHLRNQGYALIATTPHRFDYTPADLPLNQKTALIFGTEHMGLSYTAKKMADGFLQIPMFGFTESFNISVSVALSISTISQRLRAENLPWQLAEDEYKALFYQWLRNSVKSPDQIERYFLKQWGLNPDDFPYSQNNESEAYTG